MKFSKLDPVLVTQMQRYFVVAGIGYVFDFGTLYVLTEYLHLFYLVSAGISFCIGLAINYVLSTKWVFGQDGRHSMAKSLTLFTLVGLGGLGLNTAFMALFVQILGLNYLVAKVIATIFVYMWNFAGRKMLVF